MTAEFLDDLFKLCILRKIGPLVEILTVIVEFFLAVLQWMKRQ